MMMISLLIIASFTFIDVNLPQIHSTMGITTHTLISKEKPNGRTENSKTTTTPKEQKSTQHLKSPRSADVNSLLAKINLPMSRFENVLEALCPLRGSDSQKEDLDTPCDFTPPSEKNNQITPHASPTNLDHYLFLANGAAKNPATDGFPQDRATPPTRGVRISKTATIVDVDATPAVSSTSRKSILQLAPMNTTQGFNPALANNDDGQSKSQLKEIHDQTNKLLCVFGDDGMKEKSYHMMDFAALYLVWPIMSSSCHLPGWQKTMEWPHSPSALQLSSERYYMLTIQL